MCHIKINNDEKCLVNTKTAEIVRPSCYDTLVVYHSYLVSRHQEAKAEELLKEVFKGEKVISKMIEKAQKLDLVGTGKLVNGISDGHISCGYVSWSVMIGDIPLQQHQHVIFAKVSKMTKLRQVVEYAQMILMEGRQANDSFVWRWIIYPISIMILFMAEL